MRWKVGDGSSINMWDNNWIPNATSKNPASQKPAGCAFTKVKELIDHQQHCWKSQVVMQ